MKKTKRLFVCALTSVSLAASFIVPAVSNAIYNVKDSNSSAIAEYNDEDSYVKLEGKYRDFLARIGYGSTQNDEEIAGTEFYAFKDRASFEAVIPIDRYEFKGLHAVFNLTEGTTEEQVNALLHEKFNSYFNIAKYNYNSDYKYQFGQTRLHFKEVCKLLKEENFIDSFVIPGGYFQIVSYYTGYSDYSVRYPLSYNVSEDEYEAFDEFVTENNLGSVVEVEHWSNGSSGVCFDGGDLETTEDILDVAIEIYETLGLYPSYISPASYETEQAGSIDVFNAVDGDANCDGELSIADATLILQYLGNADKYSLSAQGEFNADVSGDYDGISAADALAIQMFETGVIDELG